MRDFIASICKLINETYNYVPLLVLVRLKVSIDLLVSLDELFKDLWFSAFPHCLFISRGTHMNSNTLTPSAPSWVHAGRAGGRTYVYARTAIFIRPH